MRPILKLAQGRKDGLRTWRFGGSDGWSMPPFWFGETQRDQEAIESNFIGYVQGALKSDGVVFACILARMMVFAEARFQFQRLTNGRPGELFSDPSLAVLERPWPGGTTGELLARMEQDASLAGNFYGALVEDVDGRRIRRLRPDWVKIISASRSLPKDDPLAPHALDSRVVGYMYRPGSALGDSREWLLTPSQVAHYSPIPDPERHWRGMSWLTPVVNEIKGDKAATKHKLKFFEHGTAPGIVVTYDPEVSREDVEAFAALWKDKYSGTDNAYRTYHLGGGADAKTLGADLRQLDFKATQGAGETRIAAAAGVGAVIAQLSEGLQGSSLNAGNFTAARRRFADGTVRPLWRMAAAALESIVPPPFSAARLWYDARDVAFLQEDQKDAAEILASQASTIARLVDAGFHADAVVRAATAGDLLGLVGQHSGMFSVQLQPAGSAPSGVSQQEMSALEIRLLKEVVNARQRQVS